MSTPTLPRIDSRPVAPARDARCVRAAAIGVAVNAALMTLQLIVGMWANSDGLVADGIHTFSDLAADGVVLAVLYLRTTRGVIDGIDTHEIQDALVSLLIGVLLIATACQMLWHGITEAQSTAPDDQLPPGVLALFAGIGAIAIKEWLCRFLRRESRLSASKALAASALHARVDAISALVATIGIAGSIAGLPMLDPIAAAMIGCLILKMGASSAWDAAKTLFAAGWRSVAQGVRR